MNSYRFPFIFIKHIDCESHVSGAASERASVKALYDSFKQKLIDEAFETNIESLAVQFLAFECYERNESKVELLMNVSLAAAFNLKAMQSHSSNLHSRTMKMLRN